MSINNSELKEQYETEYYIIYPKEGKVVSKSTKREIAPDNSKIVVIKGEDQPRSRVKKIRFIYEAVNGPLPHGAIIKAKDGNEANAKYDNIEVITDRVEYFKDHNWSMLNRFTKKEVETIRAEYATGDVSYDELARKYCCGLSTIQKIMQGRYVYDKKEGNA